MDDFTELETGVMGGRHPFTFFFEELWPLISERVDSTEILKLSEAIPELEGHFEVTKHYWLFDQVIPHLSKWLKGKDLLSLRLTCKQWSHAVDNFLENQPIRRAYDHEGSVTGQLWMVDGTPTVNSFQGRILPSVNLTSQESIRKFREKMGEPTRSRNPFIGRTIHIQSSDGVQGLAGISSIFQRFGKHLWALSLALLDFNHLDHPMFCFMLREWIGYLPNLKNLYLWIPSMNIADLVEQPWTQPLPPLPHLETLTIAQGTLPASLLTAFFSAYSKQIRRLGLDIRYWKGQYANMFPNLTELMVIGVITQDRMADLLLSLHAPRLHYLSLTSNSLHIATARWSLVTTALKRFPQLRNLILSSHTSVMGSDDVFIPEQDSIQSIKYLQVGKQCLFYSADFLRCFPNLEYLYVSQSLPVTGRPPFPPTLDIWNPLISLRMYNSNLWELLPKLKGVVVDIDDNIVVEREGRRPARFSRETYDYQRKMDAASANR